MEQAQTGVHKGNPVQRQELGGGFSLVPLGKDDAAGDAGNPRQISLFLQAQEVVVRNRGAAEVAALDDLPNGWRVRVVSNEVTDECQYSDLPL